MSSDDDGPITSSRTSGSAMLAVDSGGTFTDVVDADGRVLKVPSTPRDPSRGVSAAVASMAVDGTALKRLLHGTTVATNALLQRRLGRVALITTAGFADLIEIARQDRPHLYDVDARRPEPLVPRGRRLEVVERSGPDGSEIEPVGQVPVVGDVDAVAVCLLHADLAPAHELSVARTVRRSGVTVVCSHEVAPEHREYERLSTTVIDAALRLPCAEYLQRLEEMAEEVFVLTSAGGLVPVAEASASPVRLLLSGPAGGVLAGAAAAAAAGFANAVTFDVGGTSTDVCLILDGVPAPAGAREVDGLAVRVPSLDVHTVGAGGGSIAAIDAGGAVRVGPHSVGADPGPACYGRGGVEATVTDANLVAGRLPPGLELPGFGVVDMSAAAQALGAAGLTAEGVLAVADAITTAAVRRVTVERGVDPVTCALVAFGGAGPLHACAVAQALGMLAVVVPARAGVLSAVGILGAPIQRDIVRSWPTPSSTSGLAIAGLQLAQDAMAAVGHPMGGFSLRLKALIAEPLRFDADLGDGERLEVIASLDCRYAGQGHEVTTASIAEFAADHEARNGFRREGIAIEVVALRASARVHTTVVLPTIDSSGRSVVIGPTSIAEPDCTIWVAAGWMAEPQPGGGWVLRRHEEPDSSSTGENVLDPAARLAVNLAQLVGVAEEALAVLRRSASSPTIRERADCSTAVFTAAGELVAQSESIPVHLGSMPASVAAAIEAHGPASALPLGPGEQVLLNDPFSGGTHLNDLTLVAPVHLGERLVGWVANRAHHGDVGGMVPGSMPPDADELVQEGLCIPPVRCTAEVIKMVCANSRTPQERRGDIDAMLGANAVAVTRLAALIEAGVDLATVVDWGERRMRAALAAMPDGTSTFEDVLDTTGPDDDQQAPARVVVTVTKLGNSIEFDLTGTDAQRRGNANAVAAVTVGAVGFALRCVCDPSIPANGGAMRPVSIRLRPGTMVAATRPAAVGAGNVEMSQRVADACLGALAGIVPDRVPAASQGTMNNVLLGGAGSGGEAAEGPWVLYETLAGGQGGGPLHPGMSGVHTAMTNTRNTPVEALERAYPVRVRRTTLRRRSGGDGRLPGGDGIERELEALVACTLTIIGERRISRPWGAHGGGPGAVGADVLLPGGDEHRAIALRPRSTVRLQPGDVVRVHTPGGGGYGLF